MRRNKLAAKVLSVLVAVSACFSANGGSLMALAAENGKAAVAAESSSAVEDASSEAGTVIDDSTTGNAETGGHGESDLSDDSMEESTEEQSLIDDSTAGQPSGDSSTGDGQSTEEGQTTGEDQAAQGGSTKDEASLKDSSSLKDQAAAGKTSEEELAPAMEIIDSDGVFAEGREAKAGAGGWPATADDVLEAQVIAADVDSASDGCVLAGVAGEYITDPEASIARINEIRWEACQEGVRNPRTGQPLTEADYVPIKWSGDLEYIARMRAAESAFSIAHARLNGKSHWGLVSPAGVRAYGEVLAWNWSSTQTEGIEQWYEEKADWVNQTEGAVTGHYTAMINPGNIYVGLGTFCCAGARYYNTTAGEFTTDSGLSETPMGMSGKCVQMLDISSDYVQSEGQILGKLVGARGTSGQFLLGTKFSLNGSRTVYFPDGVNWSSSDPSIVKVSADGTWNAVKSGTATIEASAAGGAVTASAEFTVKSIEDCDIELAQTTYTYDGEAKKPGVTVSYHGTALKAGTDYTVAYEDNVDAGTATVTITGSEEYAGSVEKTFTIEKAAQTIRVKDLTIEFDASAPIEMEGAQGTITYTSQNTDAAIVSEDGVVTGTGAGSAVITVKADGGRNYKPASATLKVTVTQVDIEDSPKVTIRLSETEFIYNGKEQKPEVEVLYGDRRLVDGAEFETSFYESTVVGIKTMKIKGLGNFTGFVEKTYVIHKSGQSITVKDLDIEFGETARIEISGAQGPVTYTSENPAVAAISKDGTVSGEGAGETRVTILAEGDENYEPETVEITVKVRPVSLEDPDRADIEISEDRFTYNGREQKPEIRVVCDGRELAEDVDYALDWDESVNAGAKTVRIQGIGNYEGLVERDYTIEKAEQFVTAYPWRDWVGIYTTIGTEVDGFGKITFSSSDPSIVSVDEYGSLEGCGDGTVTITVSASGDENHLPGQTTFEVTGRTVYEVASGPCGESATWTYFNNGDVMISGSGMVELVENDSGEYLWDRYYVDDPVWHYERVRRVVVMEGITGIGSEVFSVRQSNGVGKMSDSPEEVELADSVTTISDRAFMYCTNLERIWIGSDLKTLGACAFSYCPSLWKIEVAMDNKNFVSRDGSLLSRDGTKLYKVANAKRTEYTVPDGVVRIGEDALGDLEALRKLTVPKSVTTFEEYAVDGCNYIEDVYFGGTKSRWDHLTIGEFNDPLASAQIHFAEVEKPVDELTVALDGTSFVYDGAEKKPAVTVMDGETVLEEGFHYTVSYDHNVDAGTASVVITGLVDYEGECEEHFEITRAPQTFTAKAAASAVAVGKTVKVTASGNDGALSYEPSSTATATVSASGVVTAKKVGTVKITVTAAETANYEAASKTITVKIVPAATASLTAANQATGIKLTWKAVTGATGYKVYRGSTLIKTITSGSTVTYTDAKAGTNGSKYTFKVVAVAKSIGDSTLSKSVTMYRVARPTLTSLSNTASRKMTAKWSKNTKASGYLIQYSLKSDFSSGNKIITISKNSTVSRVIGSLTKGKKYYVRVRSFKTVSGKKYYSAWSSYRATTIRK